MRDGHSRLGVEKCNVQTLNDISVRGGQGSGLEGDLGEYRVIRWTEQRNTPYLLTSRPSLGPVFMIVLLTLTWTGTGHQGRV